MSMTLHNHAQESGTGTPSPPTRASPSSFFAVATGVFVSPARTFENAARYPRFFAPFFATLLWFAGFWGVVYLKLGSSGMAVAAYLWYFTLLGVGMSTDSDDRAAPGVMAASLAALWVGWNVFFAAFRDVLMRR
jgi:hypothetical protein